MFHSIIFLVLSATTQYTNVQAHQDSLFIYNAYTESAKVFEEATEPIQWKTVNDSVGKATAEAFVRLHKYNKTKYVAADELNREAIGVALVFPQPSNLTDADFAKSSTDLKADAGRTIEAPAGKEIAFKVLDEQTHFIIGPNGKGRIPYVVMNYYAKGRILVKSEKLDPITHNLISVDYPGLATSSN